MSPVQTDQQAPTANWRARTDFNLIIALLALVFSGLSYYRSYIYKSQDLVVTVT